MAKLALFIAISCLCLSCGGPIKNHFSAKGTITDSSTGSPLQAIRVRWHIIVPPPGDGPNNEVGSDINGKYSFEADVSDWLSPGEEAKVVENDTTLNIFDPDGLDNGGNFSSKDITIKLKSDGTPTVTDIALDPV